MAVFYNYIKGCGVAATNPIKALEAIASTTDDAWTILKWSDALKYDKTTGQADLRFAENNPIIYFNNQNNFSENGLLSTGRIITSDARDQEINFPFYFWKDLGVSDYFYIGKKKTAADIYTIELSGDINKPCSVVGVSGTHHMAFTKQSMLWFFGQDTSKGELDGSGRPRNWGSYGNIYQNADTLCVESAAMQGGVKKRQPIYIGASKCSIQNSETGEKDAEFCVQGKCEALYFNATSDRRAKSNITPAQFSALQTIKSLPIYTFNYNNKEEKTLGLIAQEAAEFNLDGVNMVDNLEATGQDGDFMQMKESKLVYVLWKAVQELSAEVEELKSQLRGDK